MDIGKGSKLAHRRPWRRRTKHRVSRLSGRGATSSSSCWKGTDHFARTGGAFKPRWLVWQWPVAPRDVPEIPLPTTGIPGRGRRSPRGVGRSRPAARTAHASTAPPPHPPESASGLDARAPPLVLRRRRRPPGERRSATFTSGSWFRSCSVRLGPIPRVTGRGARLAWPGLVAESQPARRGGRAPLVLTGGCMWPRCGGAGSR